MFEVHSKADCPWCEKAKALLDRHKLAYVEYRHDEYQERQAMYDRLHLEGKARTVPQIFYTNGNFREYIGGCTELHRVVDERLQMENFDADF